jgi:hypothetical protein
LSLPHLLILHARCRMRRAVAKTLSVEVQVLKGLHSLLYLHA